MSKLKAERPQAWIPRDALRPNNEERDGELIVAANGSPACFGGWNVVFEGLRGGRWIVFEVVGQWRDVESDHDNVRAVSSSNPRTARLSDGSRCFLPNRWMAQFPLSVAHGYRKRRGGRCSSCCWPGRGRGR
jgi:hypothetical protein